MFTLRTPAESELYLDYLLIIPGNNFKEQQLTLASTDVATNLMADCLQNDYYIDPQNSNGNYNANSI